MAVQILRPDGSGDLNEILKEVGAAAPNHYLNVDEVSPDDDISMVFDDASLLNYDLYELSDHTILPDHAISKIVIHGRFKAGNVIFLSGQYPEFILKSGGETDSIVLPHAYAMENGVWFDDEWELPFNPITEERWTLDELTSLQVGCGLMRCRFSSITKEYCTQIYVAAHYVAGFSQAHIIG